MSFAWPIAPSRSVVTRGARLAGGQQLRVGLALRTRAPARLAGDGPVPASEGGIATEFASEPSTATTPRHPPPRDDTSRRNSSERQSRSHRRARARTLVIGRTNAHPQALPSAASSPTARSLGTTSYGLLPLGVGEDEHGGEHEEGVADHQEEKPSALLVDEGRVALQRFWRLRPRRAGSSASSKSPRDPVLPTFRPSRSIHHATVLRGTIAHNPTALPIIQCIGWSVREAALAAGHGSPGAARLRGRRSGWLMTWLSTLPSLPSPFVKKTEQERIERRRTQHPPAPSSSNCRVLWAQAGAPCHTHDGPDDTGTS